MAPPPLSFNYGHKNATQLRNTVRLSNKDTFSQAGEGAAATPRNLSSQPRQTEARPVKPPFAASANIPLAQSKSRGQPHRQWKGTYAQPGWEELRVAWQREGMLREGRRTESDDAIDHIFKFKFSERKNPVCIFYCFILRATEQAHSRHFIWICLTFWIPKNILQMNFCNPIHFGVRSCL